MFYVYVLINKDGKVYISQTSDINRRIEEHNFTGNGYTSKYRPWKLVCKKEFLKRKDAMKEERRLKSGVGRDWIKNFIDLNDVG